MWQRVRSHWREYSIEAAGLGLFMISAGGFAIALTRLVPDPLLQRVCMGIAMGLTAIAIIYSPPGKISGAHINPSVTLTFLVLRKIHPVDALFYAIAQFAGGALGLLVVALVASEALAGVNYVATLPGPQGAGAAFVAETVIAFILMMVVLVMSNSKALARYTGIAAGALVASFITFESPVSGMSMNPARTFGSAVNGGIWTSLWIYFTAPVLGMIVAALLYRALGRVSCAKIVHHGARSCIFDCQYGAWASSRLRMTRRR